MNKLQVGQRVVLNPWLSCEPRGITPVCAACQRGELYLCENFTSGSLPTGMHIGNCSPITGGFAPLFAAHQSQLFPIPSTLSFDQAVLSDPFSVSLHATLKAPPVAGGLALVYGCGTLGLLTIAILKNLYPQTSIIAIARYPHQEEWARKMGAQHVIRTKRPVEIIEKIAEIAGTKIYQPWNGKPMLMGGVNVIYDTIGSPETIETDIRMVQPRSKVVITGVANPARFEWTPLYFKEIELIGSNAFGIETFEGQRLHAMQIYLNLLEQNRLDLADIITHRFPLDQYRPAFLAAHQKIKSAAVKVVFEYPNRS
ncbi:MAG: zinc-binding dehydrogenase [Anaerolineaceae bacterium]|nr:zinc-binding dehydrogenase [Anaerolineaceae bacterium]